MKHADEWTTNVDQPALPEVDLGELSRVSGGCQKCQQNGQNSSSSNLAMMLPLMMANQGRPRR